MTLRLAGLGLATALLWGCAAQFRAQEFATWETSPAAVAGPVELSFHGIPIRSGQIIASEQGSAQSMLLTLMVAQSYQYTHTGLIVVTDGQAFVYEANGKPGMFLWGRPPTEVVDGEVRRLVLEDFIRDKRFVTIHDPPPGVDVAQVVRFAQGSLESALPFDPTFDLRDSTRVYCNEFVALALEAGDATPRPTVPLNSNASVQVLNDWLGISAPAIITGEAVLAGGQRVALLSQRHSQAQIRAYFALKAELHRRFTSDQKLGNVFNFSSLSGLQLRDPVRLFMQAINDAATGWTTVSDAELAVRVEQIATQMLGPFEQSPDRRLGRSD
jgi:hypothetical protein